MTTTEFSNQFDVLYNNITSNQAPGLNEYEKSLFLTKAQDEIIKNYFTANSKGNNIGQGYDDSAKRQADFSVLMKTAACSNADLSGDAQTITYTIGGNQQSYAITKIDPRSKVFAFPTDTFIVINEVLESSGTPKEYFQVIPLRYDEYTRLMSKPYKRPLKNQAWRLINSGTVNSSTYSKFIEIIAAPDYDTITNVNLIYHIRYIRRPLPIILGNIDDLTINGWKYKATSPNASNKETDGHCELDPILHEDILQRAVELAKVAWTATGQDNAQMVMAAGQRSE